MIFIVVKEIYCWRESIIWRDSIFIDNVYNGVFNILICIFEEFMVVIYNYFSFGIVKFIFIIIVVFRDFSRWNTVC